MGTLFPDTDSHLESIVYFLSESLAAAVEAGDRLQDSICRLPNIEPGMDCAQVSSQLAGFRRTMEDLWACELLMLTKILRANDLAKELRPYAPELKAEIDTFRLTSVMARDLQDMLLPKTDAVFNGTMEPKRFLESRGHTFGSGGASSDMLAGYKIAGQVDVRLLLDACEALHYSLSSRYGFADSIPESHRPEAGAPPPAMPAHEAGQDALLLSDFGEIVSDPLALQLNAWNNRQEAQRLRN